MGDFSSNAENATSPEHYFKTGLPVGPSSFPQTIGLVADVGLTSNSTVTLTGLMANQPEMVLFVGGGFNSFRSMFQSSPFMLFPLHICIVLCCAKLLWKVHHGRPHNSRDNVGAMLTSTSQDAHVGIWFA